MDPHQSSSQQYQQQQPRYPNQAPPLQNDPNNYGSNSYQQNNNSRSNYPDQQPAPANMQSSRRNYPNQEQPQNDMNQQYAYQAPNNMPYPKQPQQQRPYSPTNMERNQKPSYPPPNSNSNAIGRYSNNVGGPPPPHNNNPLPTNDSQGHSSSRNNNMTAPQNNNNMYINVSAANSFSNAQKNMSPGYPFSPGAPGAGNMSFPASQQKSTTNHPDIRHHTNAPPLNNNTQNRVPKPQNQNIVNDNAMNYGSQYGNRANSSVQQSDLPRPIYAMQNVSRSNPDLSSSMQNLSLHEQPNPNYRMPSNRPASPMMMNQPHPGALKKQHTMPAPQINYDNHRPASPLMNNPPNGMKQNNQPNPGYTGYPQQQPQPQRRNNNGPPSMQVPSNPNQVPNGFQNQQPYQQNAPYMNGNQARTGSDPNISYGNNNNSNPNVSQLPPKKLPYPDKPPQKKTPYPIHDDPILNPSYKKQQMGQPPMQNQNGYNNNDNSYGRPDTVGMATTLAEDPNRQNVTAPAQTSVRSPNSSNNMRPQISTNKIPPAAVAVVSPVSGKMNYDNVTIPPAGAPLGGYNNNNTNNQYNSSSNDSSSSKSNNSTDLSTTSSNGYPNNMNQPGQPYMKNQMPPPIQEQKTNPTDGGPMRPPPSAYSSNNAPPANNHPIFPGTDSKPVPKRQYDVNNNLAQDSSDLSPSSQAGPGGNRSSASSISGKKHEITIAEFENIRKLSRAFPHDFWLQLDFAKKLVEASTYLANKYTNPTTPVGGNIDFSKATNSLPPTTTVDSKTERKNREFWTIQANKIVKKLAQHNPHVIPAANIANKGGDLLGNKDPKLPQGVKWTPADAMFFLAANYGSGGLGLEVDYEKAYELYLKAATKYNHAESAYRTAVCNEIGAGVRRDPTKAITWYRKAAQFGDVAAMYKLGMISLNGLLDQKQSFEEGVMLLERAAEKADSNNPHAVHELGLIYERADTYPGNVVIKNGAGGPNNTTGARIRERDEIKAFELFLKAANLGYPPSQFRLGCAYEYGTLGCAIDPRKSIAWYSRAAERGEPESELALSGWYLTGSEGILSQSDTEAYLWAKKAAEKGLSKAEYAVGYYTEVGIGVAPNPEEAKKWYFKAAAQRHPKALARLQQLRGGAPQ